MEEKETSGISGAAIVKRIIGVLDGSFLTRDNMVNNLPFLFWLFGLGIIYIANSHYAEKTVILTNKMEKEVKELRSDYIATRSELMFASKQSEVARAVQSMGIYESRTPPKKIVVKKEEIINE
jgi:hypothetical protein